MYRLSDTLEVYDTRSLLYYTDDQGAIHMMIPSDAFILDLSTSLSRHSRHHHIVDVVVSSLLSSSK